MTIDKEALLKARFTNTQDIEIEGVGTITIRALTRGEALAVKGKDMDLSKVEQYLLACALVEPKLTEDEVKAWQEVSPAGEMEPIANAILKLSGMEKYAPKEAMTRFRG